jgi:DNA-binding NarL/FixJ family response regulator
MALRCLIVDDSAGFLEAARALLEHEGVSVVAVASTGEEALARVVKLRPDVTLIDIDLGGESGFAVVRELAQEGRVDARSLILISTHAREEFADLIEASPAAGFLSKSDLSADAIRALLSDNGSIGSSTP